MKGGDYMPNTTPEREARRFDNWLDAILPGKMPYDFMDKPHAIKQKIKYMLNRTRRMFRWSGLPDTVPERMLELYLQTNGNVCWYEYKGKLYVFTGGLGGEPDEYYRPTIYTIANPALNLHVTPRINEECVVMLNDSAHVGMMPMYSEYATAMTETELSLDIANVNSRIIDLISAPDDRTRASALQYLEDVRKGKPGVIAGNAFLDGIKAQPYGNTGFHAITDLIELLQYHKASWYNELGLNANYNMKRESLNSSESQLNNDALLPLVDDLLGCRVRGCELVNEMFGTNISVELASSWEDNQEEIDAEQDAIAETEQAAPYEQPVDETEGGEAEDGEEGETE